MTKKSLRIVTWNCNGALRKKWHRLATLNADVYVVQECEDPCQTNDAAYSAWCGSHLWTGTFKSKGIGIFTAGDITLQAMPLAAGRLELFLPCIVDGDWPLLATWTKKANSPNFGYIGQLWKYLQEHKTFLANPRAMPSQWSGVVVKFFRTHQ